jgi:hypothetical protein
VGRFVGITQDRIVQLVIHLFCVLAEYVLLATPKDTVRSIISKFSLRTAAATFVKVSPQSPIVLEIAFKPHLEIASILLVNVEAKSGMIEEK